MFCLICRFLAKRGKNMDYSFLKKKSKTQCCILSEEAFSHTLLQTGQRPHVRSQPAGSRYKNLLHHNSPCCYFGQYHIVTVTCSLHHLVYKHPLPTRWVVEKFQKVQKQPASDQSNQMEACGAVSNTSNHMGNTDLSLAGGGCWRWLNSL